jgi:23S rRNA pseudouridine1911/1915/1917 synthase
MNRILEYNISRDYEGIKLSSYLEMMAYPSSILKDLRKDDSLCKINNKPSYLNSIIHTGEHIEIYIKETVANESLVPVQLDFDIVYEDEDILLVNKPANMPIHQSINNYENSLANALAYYYRNESSPFIFRCINRLDKDTSGLTLIAKNPLSAAILSKAMKERQIKRTYTAIVEGIFNDKEGRIEAPIARKKESCIERCVDFENGQRAITNYKVIKELENSRSLVEFSLETGRTHQIRVHMKYLGHPLLGDILYNPDDKTMERQALHAGKLIFLHPIKLKEITFKADYPDDMKNLIN